MTQSQLDSIKPALYQRAFRGSRGLVDDEGPTSAFRRDGRSIYMQCVYNLGRAKVYIQRDASMQARRHFVSGCEPERTMTSLSLSNCSMIASRISGGRSSMVLWPHFYNGLGRQSCNWKTLLSSSGMVGDFIDYWTWSANSISCLFVLAGKGRHPISGPLFHSSIPLTMAYLLSAPRPQNDFWNAAHPKNIDTHEAVWLQCHEAGW